MTKRLQLMDNGPVTKALLYLGLPTIIGLTMTGFYHFIDSFYVAKISVEALSAVSIVYPLGTLVPGLGLLFGNGGAAFISELLGAKQKEKAEQVLATTIFYCIISSLLSLLLLPILKPLLIFMGASENILPMAIKYGRIVILSFGFHILSVSLMNLVRAEGAIALSTVSQIAGAVLNIILAPIFIWPLKLGVEGAAIATAISQFISFAILMQYYLRKKSYLKLNMRNISLKFWILSPILKVGIPLFAINLFQSLSLTAINIAAAPYGDKTIAALGIVNRVIGMTTYTITGFSRGYQTFISYNYGAMHFERIREATKKAYTWGIIGGLIISLSQIGCAKFIMQAFTTDLVVIKIGIKAMIGASIFFFSYGFQAIAIVYLLCIKYSKAGFVFSIARQGLVFLPVLFFMEKLLQQNGIFFAQSVADFITTILIILFLIFVVRKKNNIYQTT